MQCSHGGRSTAWIDRNRLPREKLLKVVELKEAAERRNLGLVPPADAPDSAEEKSLCIQN